jgi:hypothetical protein
MFRNCGYAADVTVSDAAWRLLRQEQELTGVQREAAVARFLDS